MEQLFIKRKIDFIVLHCSAGNQNNTAEQVQQFDFNILNDNGYHVIVESKPRNILNNSGVRRMVSDDQKTSGIRYFKDKYGTVLSNSNAIHICWIGGLLMKNSKVIRDNNKKLSNGYLGDFIPTDNRTDYQKEMLREIVKYYAKNIPNAKFVGHNQIAIDKLGKPSYKTCPNFDVRDFCQECGVKPLSQIYYPDNFGVVARLPLILK